MTNEAKAESNNFTCLNFAVQGGIRQSQMSRKGNDAARGTRQRGTRQRGITKSHMRHLSSIYYI